MSMLPMLVEPEQLHPALTHEALLIVDMSNPENYASKHLPGAVNLPYANIMQAVPPAGGMLPDEQHLSKVLSAIGLRSDHHVVAYDGEQGGRAARFLWTLDVLGHSGLSLLNGGLSAWKQAAFPLNDVTTSPSPSQYKAQRANPLALADKAYILSCLNEARATRPALLDARSAAEYAGLDVRAKRGGHIPGAVNLNWLDTIDSGNALRFKPDTELRAILNELGLQQEQEIITYCQTHHRSAHSYWMLKHLGYPHIRGYAGSWSEWGNDPSVPIEKL